MRTVKIISLRPANCSYFYAGGLEAMNPAVARTSNLTCRYNLLQELPAPERFFFRRELDRMRRR